MCVHVRQGIVTATQVTAVTTAMASRAWGDNPRGLRCNPLGCSTERGDSGPVLEL